MILAADDLVVRFGPVVANQGVSLHVAEGETVALLGPNGAGKTTFLSAVAGLVSATSGKVKFQGKNITGLPPERIARKGLALVPESRRIFKTLTVTENLVVGASPLSRSSESEGLERAYERFPILLERRSLKAGLLSGGEQQQLAIARALMSRPALLLLDEPSLGLAPKLVSSIFETIRDLKRDGVTMLLVEQNARKAIRIADRVYILRGGRLVAAMTGEEAALNSHAIEEEYFGGSRGVA